MNDIWYMLQQHNRYVYHYTRACTLTDYILPSGKLRFSRFQNVNDPRESKDWIFNYRSMSRDLNFDTTPIERKLNKSLKHSWRIGCFVSDPYEALVTREREDLGEDILEAAYERGHSRPRMWAQYGEGYKGACLVFDKFKLNADICAASSTMGSKVYADKVVYRNPPIVPDLRKPGALIISIDEIDRIGFGSAVEAHILNHWKELFFVKSRDWEQEREFRWIIDGKGDEDFYINIQNSLVGIALGDLFPDHLKTKVGQFASSSPVSIAIMHWQNGVPQPAPTNWRLL